MDTAKRSTARRILKNRDFYAPLEFISHVFNLTSDPRLVADIDVIPLTEQQEIAFDLLIKLIEQPGKVEEKEEKEKEEFEGEVSEKTYKKKEEVKKEPPKEKPEADTSKKQQKDKYEYKAPPQEPKPEYPNYYEILGVRENASAEEIKNAYRILVKEHHPDVTKDVEDNAIMQDINEAHDVLKSKANKQNYDSLRKKDKTTPQPKPSKAPPGARRAKKPDVAKPHPDKKLLINLEPTLASDNIDVIKAKKSNSVTEFKKLVAGAGYYELTPSEKAELVDKGVLPTNYQPPLLAASTAAAAAGVNPDNLMAVAEQSKEVQNFPQISEAIEVMTDLGESFASGDPSLTTELQLANQNPQVTSFQIVNYSQPTPSQPFQLQYGINDTGLLPLFERGKEEVIGRLKSRGKGLLTKGAKRSGKFRKVGSAARKIKRRAVKKIGKKAVTKAATKIVAKKLAAQAIGSIVPGIGNVVAFVAEEVISRAYGFAKKHAKKFAAAGGAILLAGAVTGSAVLVGVGGTALLVGGVSGGLAAVGAGTVVLFNTFTSLFIGGSLATIAISIILGVIVVPLITALTIYIITTGAYVIPESSEALTTTIIAKSEFISVTKTAREQGTGNPGPFENEDLPLTIEYTITITARDTTLTNIKLNDSCRVIREGSIPSCPQPNPQIPSTSPEDPLIPDESITIQYVREFNNDTYSNSFVTDSFTATADTPTSSGETSIVSASITIGTPPIGCPSGWPVTLNNNYFVNQGPGGYVTHSLLEAIDVHVRPVTRPPTESDVAIATHIGTIDSFGVDDNGGKYINIRGNCGGNAFMSRHVHFLSIDQSITVGMSVTPGTVLGRIGCTGYCNFPHDHYMFIDEVYGNNPPFLMESPYIPEDAPGQLRGCVGISVCNQYIP